MSIRFQPRAAERLRRAIDEAGGVEVFAIGDVDDRRHVVRLEIHARGNRGAVPALLTRPRAGQVVIHNHPSGDLTPSDADFALAAKYGDEGIGVVIVDSAVSRDSWVVEPAVRAEVPIDRDRLRAFFLEDLPRVLPGCERRGGQLEMAEAVADALEGGGVLVAEAGTGTGKSLAYLVPGVLWALANDAKVAVSTYTIHLQSQLMNADLPLLRRAGVEFTASLVKGRNNYLCRRKLEAAAEDGGADGELLKQLLAWSEQGASEGTRQEWGEAMAPDLWERVESDAHQTLRARCEHYNRCFYYQSRRRAGASHLLVMNHALLLADRVIKDLGGSGVVPRYDRVILDEGHHLEDAATGAGSTRLNLRAINRALSPLLDSARRKGALTRVERSPAGTENPEIHRKVNDVAEAVSALRHDMEQRAREIGTLGLAETPQLRITAELQGTPWWEDALSPAVEAIAQRLEHAAGTIGALEKCVDLNRVETSEMQPWLDLGRARVRLEHHSDVAWRFMGTDGDTCRWLERDTGRDLFGGTAKLCTAPIDVGPLLRQILFDPLRAVGVTSATLSVNRSFDHYLRRHGLLPEAPAADPHEPWPEVEVYAPEALEPLARTAIFPSPFDYARQALLLIPRDLPPPEQEDRWYAEAGAALVEMVRLSGGGAFVLCTSYEQIARFSSLLRAGLPRQHRVFAQGDAPREQLLLRYLEHRGAVLVGTDSFWEGVSVKGEALRLVIIPRLPFRVPTEPVAQARYERLEARGVDPFRAMSLPQAVIKLRQGFGRLIRTAGDRGAVAILDRRVINRWYGRAFLSSLPPARRITGPTRMVLQQLERFYQEADDGR